MSASWRVAAIFTGMLLMLFIFKLGECIGPLLRPANDHRRVALAANLWCHNRWDAASLAILLL